MVALGRGRVVTFLDITDEQPSSLLIVTVYVPACVTDKVGSVVPSFHMYEVPPVAVRSVCSPSQIRVAPTIFPIGAGSVEICMDFEAEHPLLLVTVTVYVPECEIVVVCVAAPVLQR